MTNTKHALILVLQTLLMAVSVLGKPGYYLHYYILFLCSTGTASSLYRAFKVAVNTCEW